jgi:hypothetical protein
MTSPSRQRGAVTWILVLADGLLLSVPALAQDKLSSKLQKKIRVMEMVIDEMLVDSPNILVFSSEPSTSIYIEEFGVIFAFDASLARDEYYMQGWLKDLQDIHIETDDDGNVHVYKSKKKVKVKDEDEDEVEEIDIEEMKEKAAAKEAEQYAGGKDEIIDTLVDYGDTLTELDDDQHVAIAVSLGKADFFEEADISRLVVKVKVRDLRSASAGRLSREDLRKRVTVTEY